MRDTRQRPDLGRNVSPGRHSALPVNGVTRLAERMEEAAQQEFVNEAELVRNELRETYMMLEAGKISEADFNVREQSSWAASTSWKHAMAMAV